LVEHIAGPEFTDWHCHILPGIDDGPATIEESLEMGRILAALGFRRVYCTPHLINGVYDSSADDVVRSVVDLQKGLDDADIRLTLHAGREYYMDEFLLSSLGAPRTLGESPVLLVEIPPSSNPGLVQETSFQLVLKQIVPLIAHPERSRLFALDPPRKGGPLGRLVERASAPFLGNRNAPGAAGSSLSSGSTLCVSLAKMGCHFQGNIGSFAGIYGEQERRQALQFLERGLYTHLGSDAHQPRHLWQWLEKGLREIEKAVGKEAMQKLMGEEAAGCAGVL
jgi:protein-tyrosine phosphatase